MIESILIEALEQKKKLILLFCQLQERRSNSFLYLEQNVSFHAWLQSFKNNATTRRVLEICFFLCLVSRVFTCFSLACTLFVFGTSNEIFSCTSKDSEISF